MSQNTTASTRMAFIYGECVSYSDMIAEQTANRQQIGSGIATQQGTLNALPLLQPLAVTTNGTMSVTIGGSNQRVLCDGYLCDGCQAQTFTVPTAPTSGTRIDAICIQSNPGNVVVATVSREVEDAAGNKSSQPVNQVNDGLNYQYVQGDTSGNPPAAPSGYSRFALISVAANVTAINAANVSVDSTVFPTMNPQGPMGPNPLSKTNGIVTIPAVGQTVSVPAVNGAAYGNGAYVTVSDGTHAIYGQVVSGGTTNTLTVNVLSIPLSSQGQQIASGATISFSGPPGATGATGPVGATGATGPAGANGSSPLPRGGWSSGTAYNPLDIVTYNGSSYLAVVASTGVQPDTDNSSHWQTLAQKGATGATGTPGAKGDKGDTGSQGTPGNPGTPGADGKNAYSTTTGTVTIPAANSVVSVPVSNPGPFPYGSFVVISDGAQAFYAQVTNNTGTSPISVKNLQTIAAGSGTVASGATVTPAGPQPSGIAVGGSLVNFGAGTGAGSITLPNDGGTYVVEAEWNLLQSTQAAGNNGTFSISGGSGLTNTVSSGSYTNTFDSTNGLSTLKFIGKATASGQVISFSFNSTLALNSSPWTIRATRIL